MSPSRFAALRDAIHAESFAPDRQPARRVGAEVELLALDAATRWPVALQGGRNALIPTLRRYGVRNEWMEFVGYDGLPRFDIPGRAIVSFEPGGQLEISSVACLSPAQLVPLLHGIVAPLRHAMREEGIDLQSIGIDPLNDARDIPLQLPVDRYERMTEYFESIGPFGIRMMRQTAAIQVSVDRGANPAERWRLLNDLAPYVIAIFANSPYYLGRDSGHESYRAHCWRQLDPSRTGVAELDDDPAGAYARFALSANDIMRTTAEGSHQPFASWIDAGESDERWRAHLTTLFPEVRPRGHFEVRSCDAIDPDWYAAAIVFLCGLAFDERSAAEASLLAAESRALLRAAGEKGLGDTAIARTSRDLYQLALAGASRLGGQYVGTDAMDVAHEFYARFTAHDRSPASFAPAPPNGIVSEAARSRT